MKKTTLITALALGFAGTQLFGQGTVNFGNGTVTPTGGPAVTNILTMQRVIAGSTFRVALYYLPDGPEPSSAEMLALGLQIGAPGNFGPLPGTYAAGTRTTLPTTPPGQFCWLQVRAWETAFGSSYEAALVAPAQGGRQALVGASNIIRLKTGDPANNVAPGALTAFGIQGFIITPVPEPSTIGLAAMGIGALLLLRRKK